MGRITETIRCMVRLANSAILEVAIRWNSTFSRLTDALKIEQPKRASGRSFASVVTRKRPSLNRAGIGMVQKRVTAQGGWGRRPEGDAPRSEASALGSRWLMPARPQPPSRGAPVLPERLASFRTARTKTSDQT